MRWLAGIFLLLALVVTGGYIFAKGYPYRLYSNWVEGQVWDKYYYIPNYSSFYLGPTVLEEPPLYSEDYPQLWRSFPLSNSLIPLPTRHPLFLTVPMIEYKDQLSSPIIGMVITNPNKREISRIYTLPTSLSQDFTLGQDLFKLPFVRNRIMKLDPQEVWREAFTHKIVVESKSMDEMIHDLYILHVRSRMLPKGAVKYGLLKDGKALIELTSEDKDYIVEVVLTQQNGRIYSYILKTAKNNQESLKLRAKYLDAINFSPIDPEMGKILYTEFKQLNFSRQVDQEGLLYLFSAWSQDLDKVEILKQMIFYLERGRNTNSDQLKALYKYAYKKYGKTFTTRNIFSESDDQELVLQRKVEIEEIEKRQAAEKSLIKVPEQVELTPDEKRRMHLKKAKEIGSFESDEMTIH